MQLRVALAALAASAFTWTTHPAQAQSKEFSGTWILNQAKSTGPVDPYEDVIIKVTDGKENYVNHITDKNGKKAVGEYQAMVDGKEYPEKHDNGSVSYVVLTQLFPRTEEVKIYRHDANGESKLTARFFRVVSADGKELYDTLCRADGSLTGFRVFDKAPSPRKSATKAP